MRPKKRKLTTDDKQRLKKLKNMALLLRSGKNVQTVSYNVD